MIRPQQPDRRDPDPGRDRRPARGGEQRARIARLLHLGDGAFEMAHRVGRKGVFRDLAQPLGVFMGDCERDVAVDLDDDALRDLLGGDLVLARRPQERADALGRIRGALLDRHAEHRRAEADDPPVEDDDVGGLETVGARGRRASRRRLGGVVFGRQYRRRHGAHEQRDDDERGSHSASRAARAIRPSAWRGSAAIRPTGTSRA